MKTRQIIIRASNSLSKLGTERITETCNTTYIMHNSISKEHSMQLLGYGKTRNKLQKLETTEAKKRRKAMLPPESKLCE